MIKTEADLSEQLQKLRSKHPALNKLTVKTAADYPADHPVNNYEWLAAFIDKCWQATYNVPNRPPKSRFIYTPNYLEWLLDTSLIDKRLTTIISDKNEEILGIVYGIDKTLKLNGVNFKIAIHSGISVLPEHLKKGIAQLLYLSYQVFIMNSGYDGAMFWFDAKNNENYRYG